MTLLTDLLDKYIFSGVPSNAVWDLIRGTWEKVNDRSWEDLYLDAFQVALEEERPHLARYANGEIALERETLRQVLNHDLGAPVPTMSLGALIDKQFATTLASAMAERQALTIGGHNLSQDDYAQLVHRLVRQAMASFRELVLRNPLAFHQAMLGETLENRSLLLETQAYLNERFDLMSQQLDMNTALLQEIKADTDTIRHGLGLNGGVAREPRFDELQAKQMLTEPVEMSGGSARPVAPLRTRMPDPRAVHLVGRAEVLDWACQRLKAGDATAIAAIRGMGGMGKTELAIAVAKELERQFNERVIWLDCGPNDVHAIQERMAAALGIVLESNNLQARSDALALALQRQPPTLVVLDDIRHRHLDNFTAIVPPCPPCALLITTRRDDLRLPPGAVWEIGSLAPDQSGQLLSDLLPASLLNAEPEAVRDVAELLQHVPLALALAARRAERISKRQDKTSTQPLATLLKELQERRLSVLHQGDRPDVSVAVTFDLSYEEPDPDDKARLRKLGVFARNQFDLIAICAVWGEEKYIARAALQRLENAGLVQDVGEDTWWMHDLLREYATNLLGKGDPSEVEIAYRNHAAFFRLYLDTINADQEKDYTGLETLRLEIELAADRFVLDWRRDSTLAVELALAISQAYQFHRFPRWEEWLTAALEAAKFTNLLNPIRRLQCSLGDYYWRKGEVDRAQQLLRSSLSIAEQILQAAETSSDQEVARHAVAVSECSLADLLQVRGQYDETDRLYQEGLKVFEERGDKQSRASALSSLASSFAARGRYDEAMPLFRTSLALKEEVGDRWSIALTKIRLADALSLARQLREAEELYRESLSTFEEIGDRRQTALARCGLANLLCRQNQYDSAEQLYLQSIEALEEAGDRISAVKTKYYLAELLARRGLYDEAEKLYKAGLEFFRLIGDPQGLAVLGKGLGHLMLRRGNRKNAVELLTEARRGFVELAMQSWVAEVDQLLAEAQRITVGDLVVMVRRALGGDSAAGQKAWEICEVLINASDSSQVALGHALQDILAGELPEKATANLPDRLRTNLLEVMHRNV